LGLIFVFGHTVTHPPPEEGGIGSLSYS
jgi:hypothetical protein